MIPDPPHYRTHEFAQLITLVIFMNSPMHIPQIHPQKTPIIQ